MKIPEIGVHKIYKNKSGMSEKWKCIVALDINI